MKSLPSHLTENKSFLYKRFLCTLDAYNISVKEEIINYSRKYFVRSKLITFSLSLKLLSR